MVTALYEDHALALIRLAYVMLGDRHAAEDVVYDRRTGSAYLFVDDADDLAQTWRSAGVELHSPEDTEWGQHEGAVVDPDGNVIRFGSPMSAADDSQADE